MDILTIVKNLLNITGDYQDDILLAYIEEIQQYLLDAGVHPLIAYQKISAGTIARGITDLWNYGVGEGKLSPYFKERVIQLSLKNITVIEPRKEGDNNELSS